MKKLGKHYQSEGIVKNLTEFALELIDRSKELVIVNIGTDKCIGDVIGPLVGTLLQSYDTRFCNYGTIEEPIHALNLESRINQIRKDHPNAFIIAIDACLGDRDVVGHIQVRNAPICPGKGVGKNLQQIGDISILGIIGDCDSNEIFTNRNIRLDFIYKMATVITKIILEMDKQIHNRKQYSFIHSDQIALTI